MEKFLQSEFALNIIWFCLSSHDFLFCLEQFLVLTIFNTDC